MDRKELGTTEQLTLGHWDGQVAFVFTMNHQLKKQSISKIIACNVDKYGDSHSSLYTAKFELGGNTPNASTFESIPQSALVHRLFLKQPLFKKVQGLKP